MASSNYVKYFNQEIHRPWLQAVLDRLLAFDPSALQEGGELRRLWLEAQKPVPKPTPGGPLAVPYFSQMDNECDVDGMAWRQCASSSCGMVAAYHGKVKTDEEYKDVRQRYGDTTDPNAHVKALRALGLKAELRYDGSAAMLKAEIDAGRPVPVGWLHHGSWKNPTGGGHWSAVIGYRHGATIHHDPYGRADLRNGGYTSTGVGAGKSIVYEDSLWLPRWSVKSPRDGWLILVRN